MSTIIKPLSIILILFMLGSVAFLGCQPGGGGEQAVTFEQLFSNPEQYNGKTITIDGFYFHGFEVIVLCEALEYSGYAEGHLIPEGGMMWVEGGIPVEVYDQLYEQQMMDLPSATVRSGSGGSLLMGDNTGMSGRMNIR